MEKHRASLVARCLGEKQENHAAHAPLATPATPSASRLARMHGLTVPPLGKQAEEEQTKQQREMVQDWLRNQQEQERLLKLAEVERPRPHPRSPTPHAHPH